MFLEPEVWEQLTDTAKFHTEAFAETDHVESVSRNDLIESFLKWALEAFWTDKGGMPKTPAERKKKVTAFAVLIKAELEKTAANDDSQSR